MTRSEVVQFGESRPMPDTINGKKKDIEMVYVSINGFATYAEALADLHNFCKLHSTDSGWINAYDENEGVIQASDNGKYYAYTHRGRYI